MTATRSAGRLAIALCCLLAWAVAGRAQTAETTSRGWTVRMPQAALLAEQFELLAFTNEFGGAHRAGHIVRWAGPVRYSFADGAEAVWMAEARNQLVRLAQLSGLDIAEAGLLTPGGANLDIAFEDNGLEEMPDGATVCRTLVEDSDYRITRVRVFIIGNIDAIRRHCIVEELTQALGLADDSPLIWPSIFNDQSVQQGLYPWDEAMVRVLYDRRLRPGMDVLEARPLIAEIVAPLAAPPPAASPARPR